MKTYQWQDICNWTGIPYRDHGTYQVECPFCARQGKKHKMYVDADKRVYHCFHCNNEGGAVGLFALVNDLSFDDAKKTLRKKARGEEVVLHVVKTRVVEEPSEKVMLATPVSMEERDKVFRAMLDLLKLNIGDRQYLRKKGLKDLMIDAMRFRSLPNRDQRHKMVAELQKKGFTLLGVPGFYEQDGQVKFAPFENGILIPIISPEKRVVGFQIRSTRANTPKDKRYFALSTSTKPMGTKSEVYVHFVGPKREDVRAIYVTEGALKADIAACISRIPFIALQGVNCTKFLADTLKKFPNLKTCYLAFDMDKFENENVLNAEKKLIEIIKKAGITPKVVNWDRKYKGIDDYLVAMNE